MRFTGFSVSYSRWDESAYEAGDTDDMGMLDSGLSLRDAMDTIDRMPLAAHRYTEADCSALHQASSVNWNGLLSYECGQDVNYTLHFPRNTTPSSRARLCRLLGA